MRVQTSRLFRATASVVLVLFAWMTTGGQAWAELRAAEKAPVRAIARLADDPRLGLSPAERSQLDYMARRTFRQNQSYVRLRIKNSPRPVLMTVNLMARGAVQLGLWTLLALVGRVARRSNDGSRAWLKVNAGAGKLLWALSGGKHS